MGRTAVAAGWGRGNANTKLHSVNLKILGYRTTLLQTISRRKRKTATGRGDSGGPLTYKVRQVRSAGTVELCQANGQHVLVGISRSSSGRQSYHSVFTNVGWYRYWIDKVIRRHLQVCRGGMEAVKP